MQFSISCQTCFISYFQILEPHSYCHVNFSLLLLLLCIHHTNHNSKLLLATVPWGNNSNYNFYKIHLTALYHKYYNSKKDVLLSTDDSEYRTWWIYPTDMETTPTPNVTWSNQLGATYDLLYNNKSHGSECQWSIVLSTEDRG